MKIRSCLLVTTILTLFISTKALCAEDWKWAWPVNLKDSDEATIRAAAMVEITRFADAFQGVPVAEEAKALVARDKSAKDPHAWMGATLDWVARVLQAYPPAPRNQSVREAALKVLDYPLHVDNQNTADPKLKEAWERAVGDYYIERMLPALREIKTARVDQGLRVWKLYNMGFVVKSKNHTVGFDINPGVPRPLNPEQIAGLVNELDILFLSHAHDDHVSPQVVHAMIKVGKKKVIVPTPATADVLRILQLKEKPVNFITLYDDSKEPLDIGGAAIRCYPGRQNRETLCSVYTVALDGCTVFHNGDNSNTAIYNDIAKHGRVDLSLANCWSGLVPCMKIINPKLTITGHENELGHSVGHRMSVLKTLQILQGGENLPKAIILDWGESIAYPDILASRQQPESSAGSR